MTPIWYLRTRTWPARREAEQARAIAASVGNQELPDVEPVGIDQSKKAQRNRRIREQALAPYADADKGA